MSNILIQEVQAKLCEELDCTNPLGYFDIKNGRRFCRACRASGKALQWKCKHCDYILSNNQFRETKLYCPRHMRMT